jgi:energy-coupling factor transporter transmembrane protein EcfT
MSPIGIILSAGVYLVPYIKNRIVTTTIGVISTAVGFASKFYVIPYISQINSLLTITGALLLVIGIGSTTKEKTNKSN